jgi:hypothetical protein
MKRIIISVVILGAILLTAGPSVHAQPAPFPPSIMYSTLLNGVKVHPVQGSFRLDKLQAVFLPDIPGHSVHAYSPENGGTLTSKLKRSDGTLVADLIWYAEKLRPPYWLLSSYKLRLPGDDTDNHPDFRLTTPGDYVVEFLLDGVEFYRFPFSLEALASGDPYNPETIYRLNGAWNDYAYMMYADADVSKSLMFKLWLRNSGARKRQDVKVTGTLRRGGKDIASFGEFPLNLALSADWIRYEMTFGQFKDTKFNKNVWHNALKTQELLAPGKHEVVLKIDNTVYGVWEFTFKDGHIQHQGLQVRTDTDPVVYIEGGKDAFWMKRVK